MTSSDWQMYQFLKTQGNYDDTVMDLPVLQIVSPRTINDWYAAALPNFAAFADKRGFINIQNINFANVNPEPRYKLISDTLNLDLISPADASFSVSVSQVASAIKSNQIKYVVSGRNLVALEKFGLLSPLTRFGGNIIYLVR